MAKCNQGSRIAEFIDLIDDYQYKIEIEWDFDHETFEATGGGISQLLPAHQAEAEAIKNRLKELAPEIGRLVAEANGNPLVVYEAAELARMPPGLEGLLRSLMSSDAGDRKKMPTQRERDTYYAYSAGEAYLIEKQRYAKPSQPDIYYSLKANLGKEIDRSSAGISETYELQDELEAFLRAYRRGRAGLGQT